MSAPVTERGRETAPDGEGRGGNEEGQVADRRRDVLLGFIAGAALVLVMAATFGLGVEPAAGTGTVEPWSGWDTRGLAVALVVGTPDDDGLTPADAALDELLDRCPAADRGHLDTLSGGGGEWTVSMAGLGALPAGCSTPLLPPTEVGRIVLDAEDAPMRLTGGTVAVAPDRAEEVAVALLLGRHATTYGFAVHAIREQLDVVCGEPSPGFDAVGVGDDRWLVRASFAASDRCPAGTYGLATVDLRSGLVHPADARAAEPLPGAAGVLAPWLDRVGSR